MPLDITLLCTPYELSFSGNPIPFGFAISPYRDSERSQDIRLQVRVLVEVGGTFREVKSQTFYPDYSGMVNLDVSTYVDPYLQYYLPRPSLATPVAAGGQTCRYKLNYTLLRNNSIAVAAQDSAVFTAIKGGMSYDEWHPSRFFTDYLFAGKKFLSFSAAGEQAALEELRFLFFLAPAAGTYSVRYTTFSDTGATANFGLSQNIVAARYSVWCLPAGYKQVPVLVGSGPQYCQRYTVSILDASNVVVASRTYITDYRNVYDAYQLVYRNSAGGLEGIRLRGQVDFEADYNRQQAQRTVPPSYFGRGTMVAALTDSADESPKFKGDTGFLSKGAADKLRDLFLAPEKWEWNGSKLLPISLLTKNTKFFSNRDSLISTQIEWQRAYTNAFYTPAGTISQAQACPAVANLVVKQVNKNKLQILYALQPPYDTVEVQIVIGADTYTYTYTGNTGSVLESFANPALSGGTANIIVKARTVCDSDSVPVNYGPYTTLNLSVTGNSLPVVVNDTFNINSGVSYAVFQLLSNDYDPDGDAIEAVPRTTGTIRAGAYDLYADGRLVYTPPPPPFTGQDYLDYEVREVGSTTTVTGRVFINVGSGFGVVYAKVVIRNLAVYNGVESNGEVWVDFFSNAAGTLPLNVTGLNLTFNLLDTVTIIKPSDTVLSTTVTNFSRAGAGTQMKVYEGEISKLFFSFGDGFAGTKLRKHAFSLAPGAGYTAI